MRRSPPRKIWSAPPTSSPGLTAVDGALVITTDLRVLGFGAEIVLDAAEPCHAYEAAGRRSRATRGRSWTARSFGMRHRSALRCVGVTTQVAAFVVSQDGQVSLFWKQDGRVLLKRNVNTANPNMIGGYRSRRASFRT
jgi:hypothetical protein